MWDILKTIVEKVFQPLTPKEKREKEAKQLLVSLHKALWECHGAYKTYFTERNELNYKQWMRATKWLVHVFKRNLIGIRTFEPQLYQSILKYLGGTTLVLIREPSSTDRRILLGTYATKDESTNCDETFLDAIEGLERFMKEKMSYADIANAQEAYGRARFWYSIKSQLASLL